MESTVEQPTSFHSPFACASGSLGDVAHGGLDYRELQRLGLAAEEVVDFSTNVNPLGPSPAVAEAIRGVALDRYPDREAIALRAALCRRLALPPEHLLAGNGSSELIWLVGQAWLRPGDQVIIPRPTYGEYQRVAVAHGAEVLSCLSCEADGWEPSEAVIGRMLQDRAPRVCFLCRPNNPTGTMLDRETIRRWAERFSQTLFVVDESYLDFLPHVPTVASLALANVLVVRSLGKAYALAGLRVGYAAGHPELLRRLRRFQPPWSVSEPAQAAAVAALCDAGHLEASLGQLAIWKRDLVADLVAAGLDVLAAETPYFLIRVDQAAAVRDALLQQRILVRDCSSFGLPQYIRVSTRGREENALLVEALRRRPLPP